MQPNKRQRIENLPLDLINMIPVFEYLNCNDALKMRCVARQLVNPANCRICFLLPQLSQRQAFNLIESKFLPGVSIKNFSCSSETAEAMLREEFKHSRQFVTPFMKALIRQMDVTHSYMTAYLLNFAGYLSLGPELYRFAKSVTRKPKRSREFTFRGIVTLHDNWNVIDKFSQPVWFGNLLQALNRDSFFNLFPVLCRTAGHTRKHVTSLVIRLWDMPAYRREKLQWPQDHCETVRATRLPDYCYLYLEFFKFDQETALKWLHYLAENRMKALDPHIPIMMEYAFKSSDSSWTITCETDLNMVKRLLPQPRLKLLHCSKSVYWAITAILHARWSGKICIKSSF